MKFLQNIPKPLFALGFWLAALAIRLLHITATDVAGDEPFSIFMAQFGVGSIIEHLTKDNSPPLFEILLHYYMLWIGDSDFLLRLFPTMLNSLVVIPLFLIGDKFFNRTVAVSAAILFIFNIYHIRFAHEVRVYALFSLAFAWALYFFLSVVKHSSKASNWIGLLVANVVLLYSHYTSFYVLLAQGIGTLFFIPFRQWKYAVALMTITVLSYSPYLYVFIQRLGEVSGSGTWVPTPGWGEIYGNINLLLNSKIATLLLIGFILAGTGLALYKNGSTGLIRIFENKSVRVVILWFVLPYTAMFIVSKFYLPMFMDRYVLYTSIPLFLAIAFGLDFIWTKANLGRMTIVAAVVTVAITTNLNPPNNRNIKATSASLEELNDGHTSIYVCPDMFKLAIAYHANRGWFSLIDPSNPTAKLDSAMRTNNIFMVRDKEQVNVNRSTRVVYLDAASEFVFPNNGILKMLKNNLVLADSIHHHEIFDIYIFLEE